MRLLIVTAIYTVLAAVCTIVIVAQEIDTPMQQQRQALADAKTRWQTNGVRHYRITVDNTIEYTGCKQELEVRDGQVIQVVKNTCKQGMLFTIEALFGYLELRLPRRPNWIVRNCRLAMWHVQFDARRGYPFDVEVSNEGISPTNVGVQKFQRLSLRGKLTGCPSIANPLGSSPYLHVMLTPLP